MLAEGERVQDHPISEADKGTVTLRATLKKLEQQIESIEKQIERYVQVPTSFLTLSVRRQRSVHPTAFMTSTDSMG